MNDRIAKRIESAAGLPFHEFPQDGVLVCVSGTRTDEPKNRLLAQRVMEKNGVLITGIPRMVEAIGEFTMNKYLLLFIPITVQIFFTSCSATMFGTSTVPIIIGFW
jgi:hypothetical protein